MDKLKLFKKLLYKKYNIGLKGTGKIDYHIGLNFFCNENSTLCIKPAEYIAKIMGTYSTLFGAPLSTRVHLPAETNDHPKLNNSELFDADGFNTNCL